MAITIEEVEEDIRALKNEQDKRHENIRRLRKGIKELRDEQDEMRKMIKNGGSGYNSKAMNSNIQRYDWHIGQIEAVISKDEAGIVQLNQMIKVLNDRIERMRVQEDVNQE